MEGFNSGVRVLTEGVAQQPDSFEIKITTKTHLLLFLTKHFIHSVKVLEIRPLRQLPCILVLWNVKFPLCTTRPLSAQLQFPPRCSVPIQH
jgi:hypothetical protein